MYDHVHHYKTISFAGDETIINESVDVPRRSLKGLLLLFYEAYTAGARDPEKTLNPGLTEEKVNSVPNRVFSQKMRAMDFWDETRRFGSELSEMNLEKYFTGGGFGLWVDLRSMRENELHGSGMRLVNTKDGVQLSSTRKAGVKGKCHVLSDAQMNVVNKQLQSVKNL